MSDNTRIAKNTVLLYLRMIVVMAVGLYTGRLVLNTLGEIDYGIYAVVGGPIALFGFLNTAMSSATQRYLTFELGRGDTKRLQQVFMSATYAHAFISMIILLLAETVGLWLLLHKMTIPPGRMEATLWAYHFSMIGTVIGIMSTPYNATIVAHEKMGAFAYISILDVFFKLGIIYLVKVASVDKLILFSLLHLFVALLMRLIYGIYCHRRFDESHFRLIWDKPLVKEMTSFALWNLWGNMASAFYSQGMDILLNVYFGPRINAARGLAMTVQGQTVQFAGGFQTASAPQITKTYAQGKLSEMHNLIFRTCKFSYFLILIIALPVFIEAPKLLELWLKNVPDYTIVFLRLSLFISIINSLARPLMTAASATGKVKLYQSVVGGILMLIILVVYIVLELGGSPTSAYVVQLTIVSIAFVVRLYIIRPMIKLSLKEYATKVVMTSTLVTLLAAILPCAIKMAMPQTILSFFIVCLISVVCVIVCCYTVGLTPPERLFVNEQVRKFTKRFRK